MRAAVAILDDEVNDIQMFEDEAVWSICLLHGCVGPETESGEHSRDQWVIECDIIEHRTIRPIGHYLKGHFELDLLVCLRLRDDIERDECDVIHIVIMHTVVVF